MRGIKYSMLKVSALWVVIYNLFCISDLFQISVYRKELSRKLKHQKHREQFQVLLILY